MFKKSDHIVTANTDFFIPFIALMEHQAAYLPADQAIKSTCIATRLQGTNSEGSSDNRAGHNMQRITCPF